MGQVQKVYEFRCSIMYILPYIPTFHTSSCPLGPYIVVPNVWCCTIRNGHCGIMNKFQAVLQCAIWQLVTSVFSCIHLVIFQCKKVVDKDMSFWQYTWKMWQLIFSLLWSLSVSHFSTQSIIIMAGEICESSCLSESVIWQYSMIINDCTVELLRKWTVRGEVGGCRECTANATFSSVFLVLYWPEFFVYHHV